MVRGARPPPRRPGGSSRGRLATRPRPRVAAEEVKLSRPEVCARPCRRSSARRSEPAPAGRERPRHRQDGEDRAAGRPAPRQRPGRDPQRPAGCAPCPPAEPRQAAPEPQGPARPERARRLSSRRPRRRRPCSGRVRRRLAPRARADEAPLRSIGPLHRAKPSRGERVGATPRRPPRRTATGVRRRPARSSRWSASCWSRSSAIGWKPTCRAWSRRWCARRWRAPSPPSAGTKA